MTAAIFAPIFFAAARLRVGLGLLADPEPNRYSQAGGLSLGHAIQHSRENLEQAVVIAVTASPASVGDGLRAMMEEYQQVGV